MRRGGLMCGVTRRGSSCAHCGNINGVFNCFWLRSLGWVWVKPIRRLEETVKDCLRKRGYGVLVGRQTVYAVVCCRARMLRLLEHTLCLHPSVCMWVLFCLCERPSALWVQGKKMSYGISDYVSQCFFVQYLAFLFFFFFPQPPETESPWPLQKYLEMEIRHRTLDRLGRETEGKSNAEKPALWFYVTFVVLEFHPLFCIVKTLFQDEGRSG